MLGVGSSPIGRAKCSPIRGSIFESGISALIYLFPTPSPDRFILYPKKISYPKFLAIESQSGCQAYKMDLVRSSKIILMEQFRKRCNKYCVMTLALFVLSFGTLRTAFRSGVHQNSSPNTTKSHGIHATFSFPPYLIHSLNCGIHFSLSNFLPFYAVGSPNPLYLYLGPFFTFRGNQPTPLKPMPTITKPPWHGSSAPKSPCWQSKSH